MGRAADLGNEDEGVGGRGGGIEMECCTSRGGTSADRTADLGDEDEGGGGRAGLLTSGMRTRRPLPTSVPTASATMNISTTLYTFIFMQGSTSAPNSEHRLMRVTNRKL